MSLKISVVGTGYLGAVHAVCMAKIGHHVVALDTDERKIEKLRLGESPIFEPGLPELLDEVMPSGRLTFTTDPESLRDVDVHFICVGTPQRPGELAADTSHVFAAARMLAPFLGSDTLVVGKSTVPVGTAPLLREVMAALAPPGVTVRLAWNPEFLREGFAIEDTLRPDRFVFGVDGPTADADAALLDLVYAVPLSEGMLRLVTDYATAELVKVSANAFLATKISFINAMAEICEVTGGDVVTLAEALGADDRIGKKFLGAGIGFGGGCLPKDIRGFMARAGELGVDQALSFLHEVDSINTRRRTHLVTLARNECGGTLRGKTVAVLGAAFKPDSDDIRDSPALDIAEMALREGALVRVHDPQALPVARATRPGPTYIDSLETAVQGADVVLHLTEWKQYRAVDPATLRPLVANPVVIDGRNKLDPETWIRAGWRFRALGRGRYR